MTTGAISKKISLGELLQLAASMPETELELNTFRDAVSRLELSEALIEEHIGFCDETYSRNLVMLTPVFEMLVMCWRPGQLSTVHDHLDSFALSKVLRGTLFNRNYRRLDDGSVDGRAELEVVNDELIGPGDWSALDRGGIHQMGNAPEADEDLVTLHFYARPLREIHVFQPDEGLVERVRLAYSMLNF